MKNSRRNEIINLYTDVGCYSDEMESEVHTEIYTLGLERLSSSLKDLEGVVIDSSCGSGHFLKRFSEQYNQGFTIIGVDLSPLMVETSRTLLRDLATIYVGDMTNLSMIPTDSCAALVNYFSIQHLTYDSLLPTFIEWQRILVDQGQVIIAGWEGSGVINYGENELHVAHKYSVDKLKELLIDAGFRVDICTVKSVQSPGDPMDAFFLQATSCD